MNKQIIQTLTLQEYIHQIYKSLTNDYQLNQQKRSIFETI